MSKKRKKGKLLEKHGKMIYGEGPKFGEVLKYYRKRNNMTQSEVSDGISCYSYFSKVENNVMEPSDQFVEEVSERLGVNLKRTNETMRDNQVIFDMIEAYYYHQSETLIKLEDNVKSLQHTPSEKLLELAIAVLEGNVTKGETIVANIEPLIDNLNYLSASFFIALAAKHYFDNDQYSTAYELLRSIENSVSVDTYIDVMKHEISYLVKLQLKLSSDSMLHYDLAMKGFQQNPNPKRMIIMDLYRLIALANEHPKKANLNIKKIVYAYKDMIDCNMPAYVVLLIKKHLNVPYVFADFNTINHACKDKWYFKAMNLFTPAVLTTFNMLNTVKESFEKHANEYGFEMVKFRLKTMDANEQKDYIHDIAYPMAINKESLPWIEIYCDRLVDFLTEDKRYKEALGVIQKRNKAMNKICPNFNF